MSCAVRGLKMSKTIATVTVVFQGNDPVQDFDVHERLRKMIEEDAVPIEYTVEGDEDVAQSNN